MSQCLFSFLQKFSQYQCSQSPPGNNLSWYTFHTSNSWLYVVLCCYSNKQLIYKVAGRFGCLTKFYTVHKQIWCLSALGIFLMHQWTEIKMRSFPRIISITSLPHKLFFKIYTTLYFLHLLSACLHVPGNVHCECVFVWLLIMMPFVTWHHYLLSFTSCKVHWACLCVGKCGV